MTPPLLALLITTSTSIYPRSVVTGRDAWVVVHSAREEGELRERLQLPRDMDLIPHLVATSTAVNETTLVDSIAHEVVEHFEDRFGTRTSAELVDPRTLAAYRPTVSVSQSVQAYGRWIKERFQYGIEVRFVTDSSGAEYVLVDDVSLHAAFLVPVNDCKPAREAGREKECRIEQAREQEEARHQAELVRAAEDAAHARRLEKLRANALRAADTQGLLTSVLRNKVCRPMYSEAYRRYVTPAIIAAYEKADRAAERRSWRRPSIPAEREADSECLVPNLSISYPVVIHNGAYKNYAPRPCSGVSEISLEQSKFPANFYTVAVRIRNRSQSEVELSAADFFLVMAEPDRRGPLAASEDVEIATYHMKATRLSYQADVVYLEAGGTVGLNLTFVATKRAPLLLANEEIGLALDLTRVEFDDEQGCRANHGAISDNATLKGPSQGMEPLNRSARRR